MRILCLQETWLTKQDLGGLNTLHKDFHGIGEATVDTRNKILHRHAPGGIVILWHTRIEQTIKELHLNVN